MLAIRYAVQETIRTGVLGPDCDQSDDSCDRTTYLAATEETGDAIASTLGIKGNYGFMHNQTDLYDVTSDITFDASESGTCPSAPRDPTCRLTVTATKSFRVTPVSAFLLSLGGGSGVVTIRRSDVAVVER